MRATSTTRRNLSCLASCGERQKTTPQQKARRR